jgi:hypothetical protein
MHFVGKSGQKSTRKCASTQLTLSLKRAQLTVCVSSMGWLSDSAPSCLLNEFDSPPAGIPTTLRGSSWDRRHEQGGCRAQAGRPRRVCSRQSTIHDRVIGVVTSVSQARHVQLGEQLVKAKGVLVEVFGGSQLRLFGCRDTLESFDA